MTVWTHKMATDFGATSFVVALGSLDFCFILEIAFNQGAIVMVAAT